MTGNTPALDEERTLFGRLDSITPEGLATGWCWSPQEPNTHRSINLVADAMIVATVLCDQHRPALVTIGVGNGSHAFETRISRTHFPPEPGVVAVQIQDAKTGQAVGAPVNFSYPAAPSLSSLPVRLERVREEGLVHGWCWDPADPGRRVALVILVDGKPVGLTVADIYREDLKESGIGDGAHAFSFLLPWEAIADKSVCQISIADRATGQLLPASAMYRRHAVQPVEHRLAELERQVRLLNVRLDDAARRSRSGAARTAGLLATIGAFFTRLAETDAEDIPLALVPSLPELLEHTSAQLPPLMLAAPEAPALTLVIAARGSIEAVYACLQAIQLAGLDAQADIVVIDDGTIAAAALLPSLVQNLRYWRVQPGQSVPAARNLVARQVRAGWIGFFSPAARPTSAWWGTAAATFARRPDCAVLGPRLMRESGMIETTGLMPDAHGRLVDIAIGEDAANPAYDMLQPVAAVTDMAMLLAAETFHALGGFDTSLTDGRAAAIEYCLRAWEHGHMTLYQPADTLLWNDPDGLLSSEARVADPGIMTWLARRWQAGVHPTWPTPLGHALLIEGPGGSAGWEPAQSAEALLQLGWRVSFAVAGRLDEDDPRGPGLRALGVQVWRAPFQASIAAAIEAAGGAYSLVQIDPGAVTLLPIERVRGLSPKSRVCLALPDTLKLPLSPALLAAIEGCDVAIVQNARLATALSSAGHGKKLRRLGKRGSSPLVQSYRDILGGLGLPVADAK